MQDATQLLHNVKMQILDFQIQAIKMQETNQVLAIREDDETLKQIYQSNAAVMVDTLAMLEKLLTTSKGE